MNVVLIDGRSGSGKTSLAQHIADATGAQILALDDLYPGWNGLREGSAAVAVTLHLGRYRKYDWATGQFGAWTSLDDRQPLVIEGCGAITEANLAAARRWAGHSGVVQSIWLELGEAERRRRALARDGETFAPHWDNWAEQERTHFGEHRPWAVADEVR